MFRSTVLLIIGLVMFRVQPAAAQLVPVRSRDYLFATNVADARALWVNPAGLAVLPEASLMAELTLDRTGGDFRVSQYAFGFNSRGVSLGYQHNRFVGEASVGILRTALSVPFREGAFGASASRYSQDSTKSYEADVGVVYIPPLRVPLQLGAVVRHIGRPTVRGQDLPVTGVGAVQLSTSTLQVTWESQAAERLAEGASGFDLRHRVGARVIFGGRLPVILVGAVDLASNIRIDQVNLGFSIGAARQVTTIVSAVERDDNPVFERFSVTGVATNPVAATRR